MSMRACCAGRHLWFFADISDCKLQTGGLAYLKNRQENFRSLGCFTNLMEETRPLVDTRSSILPVNE